MKIKRRNFKTYLIMSMPKIMHIWLKHRTKRLAKNSVKRVKDAIDLATLFECRDTKWFKNFLDEVDSLRTYQSIFIKKNINININLYSLEDQKDDTEEL